jgi:Tfp pilus assembly protein PilF
LQLKPDDGDARLLLSQGWLETGEIKWAEEEARTVLARSRIPRGHIRNSAASCSGGTTWPAPPARSSGRCSSIPRMSMRCRVSPRSLSDPGVPRMPGSGWRRALPPRRTTLLQVLTARAYVSEKNWAAAERTLKKAIDSDPTNLSAYALLGGLYFVQGRVAEGRAEYDRIARRQPRSVPAHTMVGMLLQAEGKTVEAKERYELVLSIDPNAAVAANNLAWIKAEAGGNLDEALGLALRAKARLGSHPDVNDTLGWIYYKKSMFPLAVRLLEQSVESADANSTHHFHLGLAYLKTGNEAKAKESLQRALKLDANFAEANEAKRALASIPG